MFTGSAQHQLDEKGRIRIPLKFKKEMGTEPFITCGANNCLCMFSAEEAQKQFFDRFKDNDFTDDEMATPLRLMMYDGDFVSEDKQGRILLPQNLIDYAGITKNIVAIGMINRVELWSEENWLEYRAKNNLKDTLSNLKGRQ